MAIFVERESIPCKDPRQDFRSNSSYHRCFNNTEERLVYRSIINGSGVGKKVIFERVFLIGCYSIAVLSMTNLGEKPTTFEEKLLYPNGCSSINRLYNAKCSVFEKESSNWQKYFTSIKGFISNISAKGILLMATRIFQRRKEFLPKLREMPLMIDGNCFCAKYSLTLFMYIYV